MLELLANWAEFLGGIAVVISLIYLGLQVRASVKQSHLDSYNKFAELFTQWASSIYSDSDTTNTFVSGMSDYNSLNEKNKVRFHLMMGMYFGITDTVMAHEKRGIYEFPEAYQRHLNMPLVSTKCQVCSSGGKKREEIFPHHISSSIWRI